MRLRQYTRKRKSGTQMHESGRQTRPRSLWIWLAKGGVSAGLLALILYLVPTGELWAALRAIPPWLWVSVVAAFLASHVIAAFKWWWLAARPAGVSYRAGLRAHFAGLVANLCLPGVAGGDVVRAGLALRDTPHKAQVGVGSVADRAVDCLALLLLAGGAALLLMRRPEAPSELVLQLAAAAGLISIVALLALYLLLKLPRRGAIGRVADAVRTLLRQPGALMLCLLLSLCVQSALICLNVLLARSAGLDVPVAVWFLAWPLAKLVSTAPISLAGLGIREASLAALMVPFGASAARVVAVGLIWQSVLLAGGLLGGLVVLLSGRRSAADRTGPVADAAVRSFDTSSVNKGLAGR